MTEDGKKSQETAPIGIVKGGTSSAHYDNEIQRKRVAAEVRRRHEDRRQAIASHGARQTNNGIEVARMGSTRMINQDSPRLILHYLNKDGSVKQDCKSEITLVQHPKDPGRMEMMFALVCQRCVERGLPMGEAQMMVRESHRKFWLDERRKGEVVPLDWPPPLGREFVTICGTVTVQDVLRCSNYNCNYAVRIDNSNVREV